MNSRRRHITGLSTRQKFLITTIILTIVGVMILGLVKLLLLVELLIKKSNSKL